jgi:hypothetical protein
VIPSAIAAIQNTKAEAEDYKGLIAAELGVKFDGNGAEEEVEGKCATRAQQVFELHQQQQFDMHQSDPRMALDYIFSDMKNFEPSPPKMYE